ncbi:MAG TPA: CPBP family intramembrane glutamic endopeptidase [Chthoniobacteraceae bacterium]|jgi:hypothetical protein
METPEPSATPTFPAAAAVTPPRGPWGFWATLGFGLLAMLAMVAAQALVGVVFGIVHAVQSHQQQRGAVDGEEIARQLAADPVMLSFALFTSVPVVLLTLLGFVALRRGPRIRDYLGLRGFRFRQFLLWLIVLVAAVFAGDWFLRGQNDVSAAKFMTDLISSGRFLPLLFVAVVFGAPVVEEFIFRGFMYRGMLQPGRPPIAAILVPNCLWVLLHLQYSWPTLTALFAVGAVLGLARHFSGSTWLAVFLHLINNAAAFWTASSLGSEAAPPV